MEDQKEKSLADKFQALLSTTGGGDDEALLNLASSFSVQLSASQIRILLALNFFADVLVVEGNEGQAKVLRSFLIKYIDLKKYHGSDFFVMRALDSVSLRRFMQERPIGVDVIKK